MANKGLALMGTGVAKGAGRAIKAATEAISSPLLEDISINGATGIIINITGSDSLSMHETNEAVTLIMEAADENAEIIFGTVIDNNVGDDIKVTVIATGLGGQIKASASHSLSQLQATTVATSHTQPLIKSEPVYSAPMREIQATNVEESVTVQTPTTTVKEVASPVETVNVNREDKSDFDRFMNDRNSYLNQNTQEETASINAQTASAAQPAPSRLIQQIRDAANKYENSSARPQTQTSTVSSEATIGTNIRAKSIAEKLGFINFDEDEFDTPSYLRKEEKATESRAVSRDFKNIDL
jgi:cell division protein FtsZ